MKVRGKTTANISIPNVLGDVDITVTTTKVIPFANAATAEYMAETYGNGYVKGETTEHEINAVRDNINLSACVISRQEASRIFWALRSVEGKTITFNNDTYSALTAEEKAVAENKGWTVQQDT